LRRENGFPAWRTPRREVCLKAYRGGLLASAIRDRLPKEHELPQADHSASKGGAMLVGSEAMDWSGPSPGSPF
jgi:hypothetical protein